MVDAQTQSEMLLEGRKLVERAARWLIRKRPQPLDIEATIRYFADGVTTLSASLIDHVDAGSHAEITRHAARWSEAGVPEALAVAVSGFDELLSVLDIVDVAVYRDVDVIKVADVYYSLGARLDLHWLRDRINALPRHDRWQALGRDALRDDLYTQERAMTSNVLKLGAADKSASELIETWMQANALAAERCRRILDDLRTKDQPDFTMLSVALREIRGLRQMAVPAVPAETEARRSGNGEEPVTLVVDETEAAERPPTH